MATKSEFNNYKNEAIEVLEDNEWDGIFYVLEHGKEFRSVLKMFRNKINKRFGKTKNNKSARSMGG